MEDTAIIRLFQERSQQAIAELSQKYGKPVSYTHLTLPTKLEV